MKRAPQTPAPRPSATAAAQLVASLLGSLSSDGSGIRQHSSRVAREAASLADCMGVSRSQIERLRLAGLLHDVGKVRTPAAILEKPGPLSAAEYAVVKQHAEIGAAMVAPLGDPELTAIVRHPHERFDGGGYPDGLAGREIPLGARTVAVADTFDALTSSRPYRPAFGEEEALALIDEEAGRQLDPEVVAVFQRCQAQRRRRAPRQLLVTRRGPSTARPIRWAPG